MQLATTLYTTYRHGGNKAEYLGMRHTDVLKDVLVLQSAQPRVTPTSYGNRRSSLNFIQTVAVDVPHTSDKDSRDAKIEIKSSFPVGLSDAEFDLIYNQLKEMVDDKAVFKSIILTGRIVRA